MKAVNNESKEHARGSKGWWDIANTITDRKTQGISVSTVIRPDVINTYFQSVNTDEAYSESSSASADTWCQAPIID